MDIIGAAAANPATELILKINALIVNPIIIVMFSFALVGFLWGVRGYVSHADDHEARVKGAQHILWGIIGMMLMISAFTLVRIVLGTFGLNDTKTTEAVDSILGSK